MKSFREGAEAVIGGCPNATPAMFRLCIDLTTKGLLPKNDIDGINKKVRNTLWERLCWLFKTKRLPEGLKGLADCIRNDGNDGSLGMEDAEDLLEFTSLLLERVFTEPAKLKEAEQRRIIRRSK